MSEIHKKRIQQTSYKSYDISNINYHHIIHTATWTHTSNYSRFIYKIKNPLIVKNTKDTISTKTTVFLLLHFSCIIYADFVITNDTTTNNNNPNILKIKFILSTLPLDKYKSLGQRENKKKL